MYRDGTAGFGFVARNEDGKVMLAGAKRIAAGGSSPLMEAMAMQYGLQSAVEGGLTNLIAETDSETLARALNNKIDSEPYARPRFVKSCHAT
ncbi:hypothetical protein ACS0TY_010166 [Phlomoides rotata]